MDQVQNNFISDLGNSPIKVVALGGLDESGKNCYIIEVDNDAFIIEAGLKYPSSSMPGVDVIIPDFEYIRTIRNKVKGIIITHGHDDQYGALPYLLNICTAPVYATETTIQIIKTTYEKKFKKINQFEFVPVSPSQTLLIANHVFELFSTTHSVAESFGFALKTRFGNIVYTSDYITDYSPLKGFQFDLPKIARLSENEKTFLLMTESEAADKPGIASPNHKISDTVKDVFENPTGKTFVSIYNQNFYNIQEIINLCQKYKKKICIPNPEQEEFFRAMAKVGDLVIPENMKIAVSDILRNPSKDVVIIITGSGEELFNYAKDICYGVIKGIKVETTDWWINAAPSVPGTEVLATDASDTIFRTDCHVLTLDRHVVSSMHAQQEDLKMMISLFRPHYYMPVKGDYRLLMANAMLAVNVGTGLNHFNTFVYDNGMALCFDANGKVIHKLMTVRNGDVMVDGTSVGEVKESAIEERTALNDGVVLLGVTVSTKRKKIVSSPDVQMRGFLYLKNSDSIVNQMASIFTSSVSNYLETAQGKISTIEMGKKISEKLSRLVLKNTDKRPTIVCEVLDIDALESMDPR